MHTRKRQLIKIAEFILEIGKQTLFPFLFYFYIFQIALLLLPHNLSYANNDTNELEPNTVAKLFEPPDAYMYGQQEKADIVIRILEKESIEESLAKLSEYYLYLWPGEIQTYELTSTYKIRLPLSASIGKREMISILGNRRFLKVFNELSLLPEEQAAQLINNEINSSLEEYKILFDSFLKMHRLPEENPNETDKSNFRSIVIFGSTLDGKTTLIAIRYKLLALILIAGNLELRQAQPAVEKVLTEAVEQRKRFYDTNSWNEWDSFIILVNASLYHKQILAAGVLGTFIDSERRDEILTKTGCRMEVKKLTHFDSPVAAYDLTRMQEGKMTDYSKGKLNIRYLAPIDDSNFDNLINTIKVHQQSLPEDANSVSST